MNWNPTLAPNCPNAGGLDAIETMIVPRARDIGGFEVRRALPSPKRQMVGPFIFADLIGPDDLARCGVGGDLPLKDGSATGAGHPATIGRSDTTAVMAAAGLQYGLHWRYVTDDSAAIVTAEKVEIAKRYLIPKALKSHGLDKTKVSINKAALADIIDRYARESGVRGLENRLRAGRQDPGVPAGSAAGATLAVLVHVYPDADHAFANPTGTRYVAEAAEDAWAKTIAFFARHLG